MSQERWIQGEGISFRQTNTGTVISVKPHSKPPVIIHTPKKNNIVKAEIIEGRTWSISAQCDWSFYNNIGSFPLVENKKVKCLSPGSNVFLTDHDSEITVETDFSKIRYAPDAPKESKVSTVSWATKPNIFLRGLTVAEKSKDLISIEPTKDNKYIALSITPNEIVDASLGKAMVPLVCNGVGPYFSLPGLSVGKGLALDKSDPKHIIIKLDLDSLLELLMQIQNSK